MQSRVDAGVAFLNDREPGWFDRIDLDSLALSSCTNCVVGQLVGEVAPRGWLTIWEMKLSELKISGLDAAYELGFSLFAAEANAVDFGAWSVLTDMWRTTIEKLRAEAGTLGT